MNRSLVRAAACTLAAAAATTLILAVPASSPSQAASFTVNDPNCSSFSWDGSTLTCVTTTTTGAPTGCSLTANPSSFGSTGGTTALTMACTGGDPVTSCNWTQGGVTGTACSASVSVTATTSFAVSASNASGANSKSTSVSVATGGGGGGGGGGAASCTNVSGKTVNLTMNWASPTRLTTNSQGFGANDALVVKFHTANAQTVAAPTSMIGYLAGAEFNSPPSARSATLSTSPCDFGTGLRTQTGTNTVKLNFSVGITNTKNVPVLAPNTDYYINIINVPGSSCGTNGACDMYIDLTKPAGS